MCLLLGRPYPWAPEKACPLWYLNICFIMALAIVKKKYQDQVESERILMPSTPVLVWWSHYHLDDYLYLVAKQLYALTPTAVYNNCRIARLNALTPLLCLFWHSCHYFPKMLGSNTETRVVQVVRWHNMVTLELQEHITMHLPVLQISNKIFFSCCITVSTLFSLKAFQSAVPQLLKKLKVTFSFTSWDHFFLVLFTNETRRFGLGSCHCPLHGVAL